MHPTPMLVYVTVPNHQAALELAQGAVEAGVAAGANISGPCHSVYRWQGEVKTAAEWQIFFQTGSFEDLACHLASRHPHITPCIIGISLDAGVPAFLDWVSKAGADKC